MLRGRRERWGNGLTITTTCCPMYIWFAYLIISKIGNETWELRHSQPGLEDSSFTTNLMSISESLISAKLRLVIACCSCLSGVWVNRGIGAMAASMLCKTCWSASSVAPSAVNARPHGTLTSSVALRGTPLQFTAGDYYSAASLSSPLRIVFRRFFLGV